MRLLSLLLVLGLVGAFSVPRGHAADPPFLQLVYHSGNAGEIEPCG